MPNSDYLHEYPKLHSITSHVLVEQSKGLPKEIEQTVDKTLTVLKEIL